MPLTLHDLGLLLAALWVGTYIVAVGLNLWGLREAVKDHNVVCRQTPAAPPEWYIVSHGTVRRECLRIVKQSLLLTSGAVVWTAPTAGIIDIGEWRTLTIRGCIILAGWLFIATTLWERFDRHRAEWARTSER